MAFWLAPGEESFGRAALNRQTLSQHRLRRHIRIGYRGMSHVIDYRVTYLLPENEHHRFAQFEALTGYMPPHFSRVEKLGADGTLQPLDDGPGEQNRPLVFSTPEGGHAMGIFSPQQPSPGYPHAGYGRFRFAAEKVVKWNCVFRLKDPERIRVREVAFRMLVPVGTHESVRAALAALARDDDQSLHSSRPEAKAARGR